MGTWSTRIFDDDGAADIRAEYRIMLGYGVPNEEAYQRIKDYFYKHYKGEDDEDVYWLSIALFQWQNGILMDEVKQEALRCIEDGQYLEVWKESGEKVYEKRKKVLETLKDKLLHEVNPVKKIGKCPSYYRTKTKWNVGDLLIYRVLEKRDWIEGTYQIASEIIETDKENWNKFFLLRVVNVSKRPVTKLYPELDYRSGAELMLYDWRGDCVPTQEEMNQLTFRKIVAQRLRDGTCQVTSCVNFDYEKKDMEFAEIVVHSNDASFVNNSPKLFCENSGCPSEDIRNFNFTLAKTFAPIKDKKIEWHYKDN